MDLLFIYARNAAFASTIASFNAASASSVNWSVDVTVSIYDFLDVFKYFNKLAQYFLTAPTSKSSSLPLIPV